jgi:[acyl-carrier-protein] S-malonyltransferase
MKLAIVFPGQGSQSVGMLTGYDAYPAVQATLVEAGSVLDQIYGRLPPRAHPNN